MEEKCGIRNAERGVEKPDLQKVMWSLDCCCANENSMLTCFDCHYIDINTIEGMSGCTSRLAADALELLKHAIIMERSWVVCRDCKHWDQVSGLTSRRCDMHDIITRQGDWCSKAVQRDDI